MTSYIVQDDAIISQEKKYPDASRDLFVVIVNFFPEDTSVNCSAIILMPQ